MRLRTPPLLKFALFSAKGVHKVPSLSHQGEYDPVPLMAFIRLHLGGRGQVGVDPLFVFQFLDDDVAEFLVFDCVFRRQLPKNLARQHAAGLVKMAPVLTRGQGTLEMMGTGSNNSDVLSQSPSPGLMDDPGAERIAILGKNQKPLRLYLGKQSLKIDSHNVRFQLVEHVSAVDHIDLFDLRGKFRQRLVLDYFGIGRQKFSYFPHLAGRFNTVYRPSIPKVLYEGSGASGQPRPEVNETRRFVPVEHLLHLIHHPECN